MLDCKLSRWFGKWNLAGMGGITDRRGVQFAADESN